ncbi:MAG: nuclear transport factor 2 family protein [Spongiibacteraceae bacterium]
MEKKLLVRLQRAEDILEIQNLFNRYAQYLDNGQFDLYAALFSHDGEVKLGPMGRATGPEAIEALMTRHLAADVGKSYHIISNPVIQLDGDIATSTVMWTVILRTEDDNPIISMIGHHRDQLVRENGKWAFKKRSGFVDIPKQLKP